MLWYKGKGGGKGQRFKVVLFRKGGSQVGVNDEILRERRIACVASGREWDDVVFDEARVGSIGGSTRSMMFFDVGAYGC